MKQSTKGPVGRPPTMDAPRQTIQSAAARLFAEKGFEQTSLQDVADAVGVTKAAVYHYFQSKQVIYDEIVVYLLDGLYDHVHAKITSDELPRDKLKIFMTSHAEYFETHYIAFVALFHGTSGIARNARSDRQLETRDRYEALLRGLLSEGASTGCFAIDDIAICAKGILSMLNWMSRWYKPDGRQHAAAIALSYYEIIYRGVKS